MTISVLRRLGIAHTIGADKTPRAARLALKARSAERNRWDRIFPGRSVAKEEREGYPELPKTTHSRLCTSTPVAARLVVQPIPFLCDPAGDVETRAGDPLGSPA